MISYLKLVAAMGLSHLLLTFVLFSAVWLLPHDTPVTGFVGRVVDVLLQPFMGPRRLISGPQWLFDSSLDMLVIVVTSALWGAVFALPVQALRRRPA